MHVLITGSSGLVGSALCAFLRSKGHKVEALPRNFELSKDSCPDAVIHLAGESISNGFWTKKKKEKILQSRVEKTRDLVEKLSHLKQPPKVFISASAVGIYKDSQEEITEDSPTGKGFLSKVCIQWEREASLLTKAGTRVVFTRFGLILSGKGGMLPLLRTMFFFGLGGIMGDGKQYMPWVSLYDVVRAIEYILGAQAINGAVNVVSPQPVSQKCFAKKLAKAMKRPCFFRYPKFLFVDEKTRALVLSSLPVFPEKLEKSGFTFAYSDLESALCAHLRD